MEIKYKILIILTFLIASFFFMKWVYVAWPRYEIREYFENPVSCLVLTNHNECRIIRDWPSHIDDFFPVEEFYCERYTCYIKEKVRVYK